MFTKTKEIGSECAEDIFCGVNTIENKENAPEEKLEVTSEEKTSHGNQ